MPVFSLPTEHVFPDPALAREDGLLAVGGDLDPRRLLLAYARGIFPWYSHGQPILWHSPDPRFVLPIEELRVGRSLRKRIKQRPYTLTLDQDFEGVMQACSRVPRQGQSGTWITSEMVRGYTGLHKAGFAHSVEVWDASGALVGGLYGVSLGRVYFGESMFALAPDASKIGFVALLSQLAQWGFELVDSQVYTDHLARFGAREIPRQRYLELLDGHLEAPSTRGEWSFDAELLERFWCQGQPEFLVSEADGSNQG